jgi:hypothetical protein
MHTTTADAASAERQKSSPKGRGLVSAITLTVSFLLSYLTVGIVMILTAPVYLAASYIEKGWRITHGGTDPWDSP